MTIRIIYVFLFSCLQSTAQTIFVESGAELVIPQSVNLMLHDAVKWQSARHAKPGFFDVLQQSTISGFSDFANIDGYIRKHGNTSFLFPVGNGSDIRTLEISSPHITSDAYATAWIQGDPGLIEDPTPPFSGLHPTKNTSYPIVAVSSIGQWDWLIGEHENLGEGTTGNGEGLIINVSIPDMTAFATKVELRLVGWNGSSWIDLSNAQTATGNKENDLLRGTMKKGISAIAIGKIQSSHKLQRFVHMYPNPLTDQTPINITLESDYTGKAKICVFTITGQLVKTELVSCEEGSNVFIVNLSSLINGVYVLKIVEENGKALTDGFQLIKK